MKTSAMHPGQWAGKHLGDRAVRYTESEAILYALSVGATQEQLDLVFEERLRVLPTFGLTLAQWAPDILANAGAFDHRSVHGSQTLDVHRELPRSGDINLSARVGNVWDKGRAAMFEVVVESDFFTATWSIFAPGKGDFGGERGPKFQATEPTDDITLGSFQTFPTQAALYRLTGDRHHIHIDPEASARIGQPKPILQGLCTLAGASLTLADMRQAHPADLLHLEGRFKGSVVPGDELTVRNWNEDSFDVLSDETTVVEAGKVHFS